jgi:putative transcriptional regulator
MNKTVTFARMRADGTLMPVTSEGSELALTREPIAPTTPEQVEEAARLGPDTSPSGTENLHRTGLAPHVATLRGVLALTQEVFAARYHIPLGTLRDWEQGRSEPDPRMCAYLTVIARHPEIVRRALQEHARAVRERTPLPALVSS